MYLSKNRKITFIANRFHSEVYQIYTFTFTKCEHHCVDMFRTFSAVNLRTVLKYLSFIKRDFHENVSKRIYCLKFPLIPLDDKLPL